MISYTKIVCLTLLLLTFEASCKKYYGDEDHHKWQKFEKPAEWKRERDSQKSENGKREVENRMAPKIQNHPEVDGKAAENEIEPPPINKVALMARYIVNQADWTALATISSQEGIQSYPFVNVISFSDGPRGNGSGIPYLFLTPLDFSAQDLFRDNRATLLMTLAQGSYCHSKDYDPMDPRCARVMLTGKIKPVKNNSVEILTAKSAVFDRHPWLAHMPEDHHFYFAKLKMFQIAVLDTFGGPKFVNVKDYLHPPTNNISEEFQRHFTLDQIQTNSDAIKTRDVKNFDLNLLQPGVQQT